MYGVSGSDKEGDRSLNGTNTGTSTSNMGRSDSPSSGRPTGSNIGGTNASSGGGTNTGTGASNMGRSDSPSSGRPSGSNLGGTNASSGGGTGANNMGRSDSPSSGRPTGSNLGGTSTSGGGATGFSPDIDARRSLSGADVASRIGPTNNAAPSNRDIRSRTAFSVAQANAADLAALGFPNTRPTGFADATGFRPDFSARSALNAADAQGLATATGFQPDIGARTALGAADAASTAAVTNAYNARRAGLAAQHKATEDRTMAAEQAWQEALATIRGPEAGKKNPYNTIVGGQTVDLENMSIAQVREYQRTKMGKLPSTAVGAYQILGDTLDQVVNQLGIDPNTKFTRATQDYLARGLISARAGRANKSGNINPTDFANELAGEWASFKNSSGVGNYDKVGVNKATVGFDKVQQIASNLLNSNAVPGPVSGLSYAEIGKAITRPTAPGTALASAATPAPAAAATDNRSAAQVAADARKGVEDAAVEQGLDPKSATVQAAADLKAKEAVAAMGTGAPAPAAAAGTPAPATTPPATLPASRPPGPGPWGTQPEGPVAGQVYPDRPRSGLRQAAGIGAKLAVGAIPVVGPIASGLDVLSEVLGFGSPITKAVDYLADNNRYQPGGPNSPENTGDPWRTREEVRPKTTTTTVPAKPKTTTTTATPTPAATFEDKYLRPTPAQKWDTNVSTYGTREYG